MLHGLLKKAYLLLHWLNSKTWRSAAVVGGHDGASVLLCCYYYSCCCVAYVLFWLLKCLKNYLIIDEDLLDDIYVSWQGAEAKAVSHNHYYYLLPVNRLVLRAVKRTFLVSYIYYWNCSRRIQWMIKIQWQIMTEIQVSDGDILKYLIFLMLLKILCTRSTNTWSTNTQSKELSSKIWN